jgi:hypothetical protein
VGVSERILQGDFAVEHYLRMWCTRLGATPEQFAGWAAHLPDARAHNVRVAAYLPERPGAGGGVQPRSVPPVRGPCCHCTSPHSRLYGEYTYRTRNDSAEWQTALVQVPPRFQREAVAAGGKRALAVTLLDCTLSLSSHLADPRAPTWLFAADEVPPQRRIPLPSQPSASHIEPCPHGLMWPTMALTRTPLRPCDAADPVVHGRRPVLRAGFCRLRRHAPKRFRVPSV